MLFPCCGAKCMSFKGRSLKECLGTRFCCHPPNTAVTSGMELWLYSQAIVMFVLWTFERNTDIVLVTGNEWIRLDRWKSWECMADRQLEGLYSSTLAFLNLKLDKHIYSNKNYIPMIVTFQTFFLLCLFYSYSGFMQQGIKSNPQLVQKLRATFLKVKFSCINNYLCIEVSWNWHHSCKYSCTRVANV